MLTISTLGLSELGAVGSVLKSTEDVSGDGKPSDLLVPEPEWKDSFSCGPVAKILFKN